MYCWELQVTTIIRFCNIRTQKSVTKTKERTMLHCIREQKSQARHNNDNRNEMTIVFTLRYQKVAKSCSEDRYTFYMYGCFLSWFQRKPARRNLSGSTSFLHCKKIKVK